MKNLVLILLLFLSVPGFSQSDKEVIDKAKDFLNSKKYESAYNLLDQFDPYNRKPDIALIKEDIALNCYITTGDLQTFSFKDLGRNEKISDYKGKPGMLIMHVFKIDRVLDSLIRVYGDNYKLYKALGDYYFEAHAKYGDNWKIKEDKLFGLIEGNYKFAITYNLGDFQTYYRLGLVEVLDAKFDNGIANLQKSIQLNDSSADAHYNIAYAFINVSDTDNALSHALKAAKLYSDSSEKGDASRMAGVLYGEKGNQKKALEYMELSNKIAPNNYNTLKILIDMNLKLDNRKKARDVTDQFYSLGPEKPTIYNNLADIYTDNKQTKRLIEYFQSKTKDVNGDMVQLGSLYFYIGRLYATTDKNLATENLTKAAQVFTEVYKPDNPVFKLIYDTMKSLK